jgi:hypothetical protein
MVLLLGSNVFLIAALSVIHGSSTVPQIIWSVENLIPFVVSSFYFS